MPVTAGLLLSAGISGYQMYQGDKAKKDAQSGMNGNVRPTYNIPQEEYDDQRLAQSRASSGMSDASREAFNQQSNAGLGATLSAAQRGGADINTLGTAYGGYEANQKNLAIYDDTARMRNLSNLYEQNSRVSADKDKAWQLNKYAPWADRQKAFTEQAKAGDNMFNAGLNGLAGAGTSLITGGLKAGGGGGGSQMPQTSIGSMGGGGSSFSATTPTMPSSLQPEPTNNPLNNDDFMGAYTPNSSQMSNSNGNYGQNGGWSTMF